MMWDPDPDGSLLYINPLLISPLLALFEVLTIIFIKKSRSTFGGIYTSPGGGYLCKGEDRVSDQTPKILISPVTQVLIRAARMGWIFPEFMQ
jgi:hypothetical protein